MDVPPLSHAALVAVHVVSALVGATGAYASGLVFLTSRRETAGERSSARFSAVGALVARAGLAGLVATGFALVALDPARHLSSPAFLAKATMTAVLVAAACASAPARRSRAAFLARAAIVAVSWAGAIALGLRAGSGASYAEIMGAYLAAIVVASGAAFASRKAVQPTADAPPLAAAEN